MENSQTREQFQIAIDSTTQKLKAHSKCISAILYGSTCHDAVWEWSDIQIIAVFNEGYKGASDYALLENGVTVVLKIFTLSNFSEYFHATNLSEYLLCALSKSRVLFTKNESVNDTITEILLIGDKDREAEMLLGFSEAVYYLNKLEKNFYVKENIDNSLYFIPKLCEAIAWIEVAKNRQIPEREIIAQARTFNNKLFTHIYDPIFNIGNNHNNVIQKIIKYCEKYLIDNTMLVYKNVIEHLERKDSLSGFVLHHRPHSFGINYDWLIRMGICEAFSQPVSIYNQSDTFYKSNICLKRGG